VPPVVADFGGDGEGDLVLVDSAGGYAHLFTSFSARDLKSTRVINAGGPVLAQWAHDFDDDGLDDLALLVAEVGGLLGKLSILSSEALPCTMQLYLGQPDDKRAHLERSPLRTSVQPRFAMMIDNERRRARFRSVVVPLAGPRLLHVRPSGDVEIVDFEGTRSSESTDAPRSLPPGEALDAFPQERDAEGHPWFRWRGAGRTHLLRWPN